MVCSIGGSLALVVLHRGLFVSDRVFHKRFVRPQRWAFVAACCHRGLLSLVVSNRVLHEQSTGFYRGFESSRGDA